MEPNALLTDLLRLARDGDALAFNELFSATYADLRALAQSRLRSHGRGAQLDTTSLVHESYLRFVNAQQLNIADRGHFMRYAGQVMRSVIVDCVRERLAQRRGGDLQQVTLTTRLGGEEYASESQILAVHEAVDELGKLDERLARVVEMRFFAGMTEPEIAEALGITDRTVRRDWEKARLLLHAALQT
jgi:RNA polymerase sigma factor (TIGR02999 family)